MRQKNCVFPNRDRKGVGAISALPNRDRKGVGMGLRLTKGDENLGERYPR
jgi:hypothetical protein